MAETRITLLESPHLTVSRSGTVKRTWRERLLSWPWRPWVKTKAVTIRIPDPNMIQIEPGVWIGHPATVAGLRRMLEKEWER